MLDQRVQRIEQVAQRRRRIDVLLAVRTDQKVTTRLEAMGREHVRLVDLREIEIQHLAHVRPGLDDGFGPDALGQKIPSGVLRQHHVDVRQMIEDLPVDLFRDALIEAAVAGLHVEHRDLPSLGRNHRHARIGVAVQQHGVRRLLFEDLVAAGNHLGDGLGRIRPRGLEEVIRAADSEIVEKHLVQLVVEILPGMHQHVLEVLLQGGDDAAHLDQFRPRADDGHDLTHVTAPG